MSHTKLTVSSHTTSSVSPFHGAGRYVSLCSYCFPPYNAWTGVLSVVQSHCHCRAHYVVLQRSVVEYSPKTSRILYPVINTLQLIISNNAKEMHLNL